MKKGAGRMEKSKYNISFEGEEFSNYLLDSVVKLMIYDADFLKKISMFIKPKAFRDEERIVIAKLVFRYWERYKKEPGDYIVDIVEEFCEKRRDKKDLMFRYIERLEGIEPNKDYVLERFGGYVKRVVCEDAVKRAYEAVKKGSIEYAEEIVLGGFRDAYALTREGLVNMLEEEAWEKGIRKLEESEPNFKSFIDVYDEKYGGWWRKEVVLVFGDYNVGKTFFMVHVGKVAILQGKKVLHITLETRDEVVWERYCMAITGKGARRGEEQSVESKEEKRKMFSEGKEEVKSYSLGELRKKLEFLRRRKGKLWLYQGIGFGFRDLKNLIDSLEVVGGEVPDVVIVDSPDQMIRGGIKGDEYRMEEKSLYKKFLELAKERNITLFLTTQAKRGARRKGLTRGEDVAEAYDKVRIVDTVITLNQTEEEYKNGIIRLFVDKHRGSEKGCMIEGEQCLKRGQFIMNAKEVEKWWERK